MGQCTSSKSTRIFNQQQAFCDSPELNGSGKRKKHKSNSPLHLPSKLFKMEKGSKSNGKVSATRGQANRFGFKKPTPPPLQLPSVPAAQADLTIQETIEPLVIAPVLPKNGTPRMSRARKEVKAPNRFGFIPPTGQLSNKVADLQGSQENIRTTTAALKLGGGRSHSETRFKSVDGKVLTSSSKLTCPPQQTLIHPSPTHYRSNDSVLCSPVVGKMAKTVANNHTLRISNNYMSEPGAYKFKKGEDVMEIRQLEQSPDAATKFRHHTLHQKLPRPMEMVFSGPKKFELTDVSPQNAEVNCVGSVDSLLNRDYYTSSRTPVDQLTSSAWALPAVNISAYRHQPPNASSSATVNERIRREVVGLPPRYPLTTPTPSSVLSRSSVFSHDAGDEEKLTRDTKANEKTPPILDDEGNNEEELWAGPGEAMALEDEIPHSNLADIDNSPEAMNPPLRTVLLSVEDPTFATLAALSNAGLLEDEIAPDSPDISCSSPSSVEPLPPPPPNISSKADSPTTPGTPTHASSSSSSDAKDRDFLIDDEIADQPGLVFGSSRRRGVESSLLDRSKTIAQLAGDVSHALHKSLLRDSHGGSAGSISTLSPCESLASDDLMGDFDMSALDEPLFPNPLNDLDSAPLKSEIIYQSDEVMKEWSSILNSHPGLSSGLRKNSRPRLRSSTSTAATHGDTTPSCHSPAKRHVLRDETKSPGDDKSDDSGIKVGKDTMQHMYQDVINIKSMLMMLQRVLQQPETSSAEETANKVSGGPHEHHFPGEDGLHLDDLRRQIVLLEMENEEKDQRIKKLEEELRAANEARPVLLPRPLELPKLVNSPTQTDRVRPMTTTLFHNSPNNSTASIVSSNEKEKASLRYLERPKISTAFNSYQIS